MQRKAAQEAQRDAERERRRAAQLEEDAAKLGPLRAEVRRLRALEDVAGEVEMLRCGALCTGRGCVCAFVYVHSKENEALRMGASTDVHRVPPSPVGGTYDSKETAAAAEVLRAALQGAEGAVVGPAMALLGLVAGVEAAAAAAVQVGGTC